MRVGVTQLEIAKEMFRLYLLFEKGDDSVAPLSNERILALKCEAAEAARRLQPSE